MSFTHRPCSLITEAIDLSKQQYEAGYKDSQKGKGKEANSNPKVGSRRLSLSVFTDPRAQPKRDKFAGLSRRDKRRKLAMEEDAVETGAIRAAVRSAKKSIKPAKIGEPLRGLPQTKKVRNSKVNKTKSRTGAGFDAEMGQRQAREGVRAKKGDVIGGMGKKKGGKPRKAK